MRTLTTEVAVAGAGVTGILVARELLRQGRTVTLLERGALKPHAEQLRDSGYEVDLASTRRNHEDAPGTPHFPWDYVYGVGGSSLAWAGVAPRFLPADFELRSRYGVAEDWPIGYADLAPFYAEAERALAVAGDSDSPAPRDEPFPLPPHPFSPVDELVRPHLGPYAHLPQARPTRALGGRAACCGSANCHLCPVDSRYSALHTLEDSGMLGDPRLSLHERTVVERLRTDGGRVAALECVTADGERLAVESEQVVLAANGLENPGILLRSAIEDGDPGRFLFDHTHYLVDVRLDRPAGSGHGSSLVTGASYAYADGSWRSERASLLALAFNPGIQVRDAVADELLAGRRGSDLRRRVKERFDHTLVFDVVGEDLPRAERRLELSPRRDALGLPLNRISYPADSEYLQASLRHFASEIERRLGPLGARVERISSPSKGAHLLGTCRMGTGDGVVDTDLRHRRLENLYVAGGSAFPTYSAHHPTLTIAALALRLGHHLGAAAPA